MVRLWQPGKDNPREHGDGRDVEDGHLMVSGSDPYGRYTNDQNVGIHAPAKWLRAEPSKPSS